MVKANEPKNINMDVTGTISVDQAKTFNILERRRITLAVRQRPDLQQTLVGTVTIWGSIVDETSWYVNLGSVVLNTAVDVTQFYNIINSITNGAAIRMIRVAYDVADGSIDIKLFEMSS